MVDFTTASRLAADLAGNVDPNEAAKTLAYLRAVGNGKELFAYLRAINQHGNVVVRSRQTQRYYQDMLTAFERHLRPLQDDYDEMAQTLGWAIRLLRYYRAVPEYQPAHTSAQTSDTSTATPSQSVRAIPEVGDIFTNTIIDVDPDIGVAIEIPGFDQEEAIGVIKVERMGSRKYKIGNSARVEVVRVRTLKSGRVMVDVQPATHR